MTTGVGIDPLDELAVQLAELIRTGLGARSQWALRAGLDGSRTEGIAGVITIKIPPRCKDFCDVGFTIGAVDVVTRWEAG